jgi:aminocarboxymuconate-semialdehyde decarboxylase
MPTRRKFIRDAARAMAGVAFTGCGLLDAIPALAQAKPRREVLVAGRRAKVIDVHAHCVIPEAVSVMGQKLPEGPGTTRGQDELVVAVQDRLRAMDQQGIDMEVLSINPTWYRLDRDVAAQAVGIQNQRLAELCAAHPDRFAAFASLALQYPDLAVQQLETAVKKLRLRGAAIGASVAGEEFSDPKFHPVWAKAEELGAVLFIHPQGVPELAKRLSGNGWLTNTIGNPLATTIALSHLIFEGTLDRFPGLKICAAHGGGYLPSYAPRSDQGCFVTLVGCNPDVKLAKKPTEYLRQMHFDTLVFTPQALRHLAAEVGTSQLVVGTDYPFRWTDKAVDHVLGTPGLSDAEKAAILGGNAAKLLGIKI